MKRAVILGALFTAFITANAHAQQLRFIVIDGKATPPVVVQTNLAAADRPTITRTSTGRFAAVARISVSSHRSRFEPSQQPTAT